MEISWLLTDEINLEQEKSNLQASGLSWDKIKHTLRSKYGESSKKGLFQCKCCHSVTTIVLSDEKVCHFKHKSTEKCTARENYKRSLLDRPFQNSQLHQIGKSAIRDQLNQSLSLFQANIIDGYLYRKELKYVPDFILEWSDGEVWSLDYITGTKSDTYQQYLVKKQVYYKQLNFKSYFLFNENQIAFHGEHNTLALNHAEKGALPFLFRNRSWEELINEAEVTYGKDVLVPDVRLTLSDKHVYRLMYFTNDFEGILYHLTKISLKPNSRIPNIPDQWYMVMGEAKKLQLDDLFRYQESEKSFFWEGLKIDSESADAWMQFIEHNKKSSVLANKELSKNQIQYNRLKSQQIEGPKRLLSEAEEIQEFLGVIAIMKTSDLLETSPGFIDRIKECEAAIAKYNLDSVFPKEVRTKINMMKIALKIG